MMITLYDLMKIAWGSGTPNALDREAEDMTRNGVAVSGIYNALELLLLTVRDMGVDEEAEERIHGVMDRLTGWCHATNQIQTAQASRPIQEHRTGQIPAVENNPVG